ncbi:putative type I restriction enzymeP M protein [Clostridium saccharobutylicum]|uniref:type I restriction-modification system subunit M n=1 Tax=Clostridium saccharobutylicum TaxID=169679 RepID=UPI000983DB8C|nr:putative type I restriction enzymeP M protein [Clostridium saccharobutylicum]MBC2437047.1 SAM-dependent DNA methyltransferase [Clostridium saccharobutylicum]NSB89500.1 type I restriction enzyme M protein [Clostridium saccharobutylicum]NYC27690.1 type I restriction enzyme M protein [Clostridium saccharobutylicum]OOM12772.1 putative type I restriction enzymeP M protein [Clostridium saccharobutylicum]
MDNQTYNQIVSFIWSIADDCLRDVYVRGKYRDVILPMTVIRRLDAVLEPTKESVLEMKKNLDAAGVVNQTGALCNVSGQAFCNASPFKLRDLKSRAKQQQLKLDFIAYLDGFSPNVQEILEKFKFRNQIDTMIEADILGAVIEKFVSPTINLSVDPVLDDNGDIKIPALDNHTMGTIFEELIRKFNEENNEEAGEHFTPRDVVELMADITFLPVVDKITDGSYLVYDGACGTGGMLTIAEERLQELAKDYDKEISINLYGQEINPETYAITKADMLLKGDGLQAENVAYGSTLSNDGFPTTNFDFMLSNPPYGKSWKTDMDRLGGKGDISDTRFIVSHNGESDFKMLPRSSDGQMLFLANKISKMKHNTELGSRIVEVHNGSSLFTGDAGQGESNLRRYIVENDWLECIIALPENMFYNTGIATFIWVVTNRKATHRKGKVQLIDATALKSPLRKNLGNKNCELTPEIRKEISDMLLKFEENEQSKIFDNKEFGYYKITVERPLRLSVDLSKDNIESFAKVCAEQNDTDVMNVISEVSEKLNYAKLNDYNLFINELTKVATNLSIKLPTKRLNLIKNCFAVIDENAEKVIKKIHKTGKVEANPLYGLFNGTVDGKECIVEYEVDANLRDIEQIPLLHDGGIEQFFKDEVLSFAPDAWIDESKTQIGYDISFTKYFYKPLKLRTLQEITADIKALEAETDGLLNEIIGG